MNIYKLNQVLSSEIKLKLIAHFWDCTCANYDVSSLIKKMNTSQSNISKHLATLLADKILDVKQVGKERFYSINKSFKKKWFVIIEPQVNDKTIKKYKCNCKIGVH